MEIEVPCSGCGRKLQVGQEHAGKMARCPVCGHITPVPAGGDGGEGSGAPLTTQPAAEPAAPQVTWFMRTPEGQEFGPAPRSDLDRWVAEGRVTADCQLREGEAGTWQNADLIFPVLKPAAPIPAWTPPTSFQNPQGTPVASGGSYYADRPAASPVGVPPGASAFAPRSVVGYQMPHRGPLILVLGVLGFLTCFIFGIIAWVMGSNDLKEMEAGRMDRTGMDLTRAGMIMGMIVSILAILFFLLGFAFVFLGAIAG